MTNSVSAIVDLELYDNALYSVLEGKSSRFISITSNIEGIKPEGFITIEVINKPFKIYKLKKLKNLN